MYLICFNQNTLLYWLKFIEKCLKDLKKSAEQPLVKL